MWGRLISRSSQPRAEVSGLAHGVPLRFCQAKEGGFEVSEETTHRDGPRRRSSSAEAAATRWRQAHPDDDIDHDPPSTVPEGDEGVPNRHSASAEAAALRWRERHDDDE